MPRSSRRSCPPEPRCTAARPAWESAAGQKVVRAQKRGDAKVLRLSGCQHMHAWLNTEEHAPACPAGQYCMCSLSPGWTVCAAAHQSAPPLLSGCRKSSSSACSQPALVHGSFKTRWALCASRVVLQRPALSTCTVYGLECFLEELSAWSTCWNSTLPTRHGMLCFGFACQPLPPTLPSACQSSHPATPPPSCPVN